jgi:hypothetical protein
MRFLALASALMLATPAFADPTVQVGGGRTRVVLSDELLGALTALAVTPERIRPGKLKNGFVEYPIPTGALDLADLRGDIFHAGGLALSAGETTVELRSFVIDTTATPVLTGLVSVNGDLVGRVPLFELELTQAPEVRGRRGILLENVEVTLTDAAADALNDIFGVSAFVEGLPIGVASVQTRAVPGTRLDAQ